MQNTPVQGLPLQPISINVEDIVGYFELARDDAKIDPNNLVEIFKILASNVHQVVLGAVKRAESQVKHMASTLLRLHCADDERNAKIVNELLKERFSHQYLITRQEAKAIGLAIGDMSPIESLVMKLYGGYSDYLDLQSEFNPDHLLGKENQISTTINQAIIESAGITNVYKTSLELMSIPITINRPRSSSSDSSPNIISRQIQEKRIPWGWTRS